MITTLARPARGSMSRVQLERSNAPMLSFGVAAGDRRMEARPLVLARTVCGLK